LPRGGSIHICVGKPLSPAEVGELDDAHLISEVEQRIRRCHAQARAGRPR
jgi:hypothetical protein